VVRAVEEEIGVVPTAWRRLGAIADPHAPDADPIEYRLYAVEAWQGGDPAALGGEHSKLGCFTPEVASRLPDLALEKFRQLFRGASVSCQEPSAEGRRSASDAAASPRAAAP
jgi:8-oxo-dGTP diphosphatase